MSEVDALLARLDAIAETTSSLLPQLPASQTDYGQAATLIRQQRAEIEKLREVLGDIARQRSGAEMTDEESEHADYEGAYEHIVLIARAALGEKP